MMKRIQNTPEGPCRTPQSSDIKLCGNKIKKSFLTPCRRVGLGKSPRSVKKNTKVHLVSALSKELECDTSSVIHNINDKSFIRFEDTLDQQTNFSLKDCDEVKPTEEVSDKTNKCVSILRDSKKQTDLKFEVTDDAIRKLATEVIEKHNKLKSQTTQSDLLDLKDSINMWSSAGQCALQCLLNIYTERGIKTSLTELVHAHGFNVNVLRFNPEEDDFL
uniref:Swi5-dependent recombination DNA repair protein 1 homolog n=1 Tax=Clastoptera arizonana TaxID=38151 RepID=A0A1B6CLB1_9HEMI